MSSDPPSALCSLTGLPHTSQHVPQTRQSLVNTTRLEMEKTASEGIPIRSGTLQELSNVHDIAATPGGMHFLGTTPGG